MTVARIDFGPWTPDVPALKLGSGLTRAENVRPTGQGYRSVRGPLRMTAPLASACLGLTAFFRAGTTARTPVVMAGTGTDLYWLGSNPYSWTSKSKSAAAYAVTTGRYWEFAAYRGLLIAAASGVDPQKWDIAADPSGAAKWADLAGTPPQFDHICASRDFVVGGNVYSGGTRYETRVQWSGNANAESWAVAPATTQASYVDLEDGGAVRKVLGGEFVTVLQERSIRRMTYIGYPGLFQVDRIHDRLGTRASRAAVQVGGLTYFLSDDGFYAFDGSSLSAIGMGKTDRYFWSDVKEQWIGRTLAAVDPATMTIVWAYVSVSNTAMDPLPDKALIYHYGSGAWASLDLQEEIEMAGEWISPAWTLDQIGAQFTNLDALGISLDDAFWDGGQHAPVFFSPAHQLCALAGPALPATVETGDFEPVTGSWSTIRTVRPLVDGAQARAAVGSRADSRAGVAWKPETEQTARGLCAARASGRFHRLRIATPAGSGFDHLVGAEIDVAQGGRS